MSNSDKRFQLRGYQECIGEMAIKENLIACMPTGSGKTLISVYLMMSADIRKKVERGMKIIFVVNTVSLAHQQAKYIEENSGYKTLCCTGQSSKSNNVDWQWQLNVEKSSVIVMTSQYCFDKLAHGFLKFSQLALLVIDECHHVGKNHPMKKIMELYQNYQCYCSVALLPRIFGMTASIVKQSKNNDVTADRVARKIAVVEKLMFCKAVTYADFEELLKYSTKPDLITVVYPDTCGPLWANQGLLRGILVVKELVNRRCSLSVDVMRVLEQAKAANLPNFSVKQMFKSNAQHNFYADLMNTLNDFIEIYNQLGPVGAQKLAETRLRWMESQLHTCSNPQERAIFDAVRTQFRFYIAMVITLTVDRRMQVRPLDDLVSYKAQLLMLNLSKFKDKENTEEALLGLIFVKRRSSAFCLKKLIEEFVQTDPVHYGFLKVGLVTGTNNVKKEDFETRISASQQKFTLNQL